MMEETNNRKGQPTKFRKNRRQRIRFDRLFLAFGFAFSALPQAVVGSPATGSSPPSSSIAPTNHDTLEKFSNDVNKVLHVLKANEFGSDPNTPDVYRNPIYDREEWWNRHISRWRYVRYLVDFPTKSRLLKRTLPQMLVLLVWSCIAVAMSSHDIFVAKLHIGLTPLSLMSTFVAGLLTLRGNQGISRLQEARRVVGQVCFITREMAQLVGTGVYPENEAMGLLAARHVTIFCWSLKDHLQGISSDVNTITTTMLPNPVDSFYVTNYKRKPPVAILMRLRQIFHHLAVTGNLDPIMQKSLLQATYRLNEALMTSERIRISPIPSLYTTHTTRLLLFYLFWLPLALHGALQSGAATLLITVVVGYAMLGLDEISHILELPFRFMPLRQLSKVSMIESADAMVYRPPPLDDGDDDDNNSNNKSFSATTANTDHAIPSNSANPNYWYRQQQKQETP